MRRYSGMTGKSTIISCTVTAGVLAIGVVIRYFSQWLEIEPLAGLAVIADR